jgi:general nucleoside transport system permease protein
VATPLILTGLSVALAFRAGLFNIGAQGQFIAGAIGASWVGFSFELPIVIHCLAAILAAILFAGLYGGLVGLLKARTGAHEVIVTIMLNYIAAYSLLWLLNTTAFLASGSSRSDCPRSARELSTAARFSVQTYEQILGFLIALVVAGLIWWLLNRSTWGFRFRAVGANASASRTAGISVARVTTSVMFIAGALAGLGGAVQVLGSEYAMTSGIGGSFGFDAITVALLVAQRPLAQSLQRYSLEHCVLAASQCNRARRHRWI